MKYNIYEDGGNISGSISINGLDMTGKLKVARGPTAPNHLANKDYVDTRFSENMSGNVSAGFFSTLLFPEFTGDLVSQEGSGVLTLASVGVMPGTYAKVRVNDKGQITQGFGLAQSDIPSLPFSKVLSSLPNTFGGYGITDGATRDNANVTGPVTVLPPVEEDDVSSVKYLNDTVANAEGVNVGNIVEFSGKTIPNGYYQCNKGVINVDTDPELYRILYKEEKPLALGSGHPWSSMYNVNRAVNVVSASVWSLGTNQSPDTYSAVSAVVKNWVYSFGGVIQATQATNRQISRAPIAANGVIGEWTTYPMVFPSGVRTPCLAGWKNHLFIATGELDNENNRPIYRVTYDDSGELTDIQKVANVPDPLPGIGQPNISYMNCFIDRNWYFIYIGATWHRFDIKQDGSLTNMIHISSVPTPNRRCGFVRLGNRLYLIGGRSDSTNSLTQRDTSVWGSVYYPEDGTIAPWFREPSIPMGVESPVVIVTHNMVYLVGGWGASNDVNTYKKFIQYANINQDGTLGNFQLSNTYMPIDGGFSNPIITNSRLYIANIGDGKTIWMPWYGGLNDYTPVLNGTYNKDRYTNESYGRPWESIRGISKQDFMPPIAWTRGPNHPINLSAGAIFTVNNRVYAVDRTPGTPLRYADIDEDGVLGDWALSSHSLPIPNAPYTRAVRYKNFVFILSMAHNSANNTYTANIIRINIQSNGTLGSSTVVGTAVAGSIFNQTAGPEGEIFVSGNRLYWYDTNAFYCSLINEDGTLNTRIPLNRLDYALSYSACFRVGDSIYLAGGERRGLPSGNGITNAVMRCKINPDGSIGSWHQVATLPTNLLGAASLVTSDKVYLIGGATALVLPYASTTVLVANILPDGSISNFTNSGTPLPTPTGHARLLVTSSRLYTLANGNVQSNGNTGDGITYYTPFIGGRNNYEELVPPYSPRPVLTEGQCYLPDLTYLNNPNTTYLIKR